MTSPRSTYGGGYYSAPSFADTPIYDSLVAERGTPQIAPIRVPAMYDAGNSYLPALPSALPALPAAPSHPQPAYGYPQAAAPQPAPVQQYQQAPHLQQAPMPQLQQAPAPYIPQQTGQPRGYPGPQAPQMQRPQPQRQAQPAGYEAMRPVAPRPGPAAQQYEDPYNRQYQQGGGGY
ncbi:DUF6643 family protein [Streptomyces sp. CA-294286]|uniref:DUF6643 family protein n=1 Tax=Streptomyces sp. CA-294286 TaxID=3240070 RepID=UPI003D91BD94